MGKQMTCSTTILFMMLGALLVVLIWIAITEFGSWMGWW